MLITDFWICGNSSPGYVYTVASTPRSTKRLPTPLTSDVPTTTASGTAGFAATASVMTAFANVTPARIIDLPFAAADDLEVGAGRALAAAGDLEVGAGRALAATDDLEVGAGRALAAAGDLEVGAGRALAVAGDVEVGAGRALAAAGDVEVGAGRALAAAGDLEVSSSHT